MFGLLLCWGSAVAFLRDAGTIGTNVYVGIDYGTTYSCVTMYIPETGVYEYLTHGQDLKEIFPSTVYVSGFSDETKRPIVSVGYEANALNAQDPAPDAFYYGHKRMIGISSFEQNPELKQFPDKVTYKVLPRGPNKEEGYGEHYVFPYYMKGSTEPRYYFTPRSLAVEILRHFKSRLDENGYNVVSTVVSTPAYFTIDQDHETALAARLAGFGNVLITKEPVAACVCYAREENLRLDEEMQVLVFDFGGGTLDISVVCVERTLNDEEKDVKKTKKAAINEAATINNITVDEYIGDNFLGGENINDELVMHFKSKMGSKKLDATDDLRLRLFAEEFKIKLCDATANDYSKTFSKTFVTKDATEFPFTLSGHEFNKICEPVFKRIECLFNDPVAGLFRQRARNEKTLKASDIQKVVFVGGSTRIPYIRDLVKKLCPTAEQHFKTDADKSVSMGACEICVNKDPSSGVTSMVAMGVVPLSAGIRLEGDTFHRLLKKSEVIPCEAEEIFTTVVDGQMNISVQVAIGERTMFEDNIYVGEMTLTLDSQMPRGVPKVKVKLAMDEFYAISVMATDMSSNKTVDAKFDSKYGKPSQDKIDRMLEDAKKNAAKDEEIKTKAQLYSSMSSAVDQLEKLLAAPTTKLSSDDKIHADAVLQTSKEWTAENRNNWSLDMAVIENKVNSLKEEMEKIYRQIEAAMAAEKAAPGEPVPEPEMKTEDKQAGREAL